MSHHLIDLVRRLGRPRILVLGDPILDRYIWGDAERVSQEAPVILLRQEKQEVRLGGAASVSNLLRGLDAEATLAGVVGRDADGEQLRSQLQRRGIDCSPLLVDAGRPTTVKERYLGRAQNRHPHQMLRVDREVRTPLSAKVAGELVDAILPRIGEFGAILISDYAKGVCTSDVVSVVISAAKERRIPVIVDPPSSGDCGHYVGATAVTPNRLETQRATGRDVNTPEDAMAAGRGLCLQLQLDYAFVTLDSDGIAVAMADGGAEHVPTRKREVYDITGAGDMVLAMIGAAAAENVTPVDLARLANVAGGLEVEQIGVVTISREQILADLTAGRSKNLSDGLQTDVGPNRDSDPRQRTARVRRTSHKICEIEDLARDIEARRKVGQRIVFTNGCFDLLHVGHVTYLEQAAAEGDCLIVAVNSDQSVRRLDKGCDRPIFTEQQRAAMLAALAAVDYVLIFDESTPHRVLERLKPDLLVKGGTYARDEIVGWELVEAYGGDVKPLGIVPGISTTGILEQLRGPSPPSTFPPQSTQPGRKAG